VWSQLIAGYVLTRRESHIDPANGPEYMLIVAGDLNLDASKHGTAMTLTPGRRRCVAHTDHTTASPFRLQTSSFVP
jgi:hypothetical protein